MGHSPQRIGLLRSRSRRSGASLRNGIGSEVKRRSGDYRGGARNGGAAGEVAVAKLLAELHAEASEDVPALVAVGDGP